MDTILQGLPKVICYLDDVLVTGSMVEEHLTNLDNVFKRFQQYNIRAKRSKCSFLCDSVEYLGHRIDANGLHTTDRKVEAVKKAPLPKNVQELRSFLGLVHYYGKFMPNLTTLLHPLNVLLQAHSPWKWTQQCTVAFEEAKKLLVSAPVLEQTLRQVSSMYPNVRAMVHLLAMLPATTCSAERSFSSLKRIKSPFRSTMTTIWLSGLTLLNVHRDIPINIPAAVEEFTRRHPRRMKMSDILSE